MSEKVFLMLCKIHTAFLTWLLLIGITSLLGFDDPENFIIGIVIVGAYSFYPIFLLGIPSAIAIDGISSFLVTKNKGILFFSKALLYAVFGSLAMLIVNYFYGQRFQNEGYQIAALIAIIFYLIDIPVKTFAKKIYNISAKRNVTN